MTVVVSTDSENVIVMLGCCPDQSSKGTVSDSVGATDPFIVLSVTLSLLIVVFDIVELSIFEFEIVLSVIVELSIVELSKILELSNVEFVTVDPIIVALSTVELSTLDLIMVEHTLTVELSMSELSVIDELSVMVVLSAVEELSSV